MGLGFCFGVELVSGLDWGGIGGWGWDLGRGWAGVGEGRGLGRYDSVNAVSGCFGQADR